LIATVLVLSLSAYWIGGQLLSFTDNIFTLFPSLLN
jgi:type III secretory pathway component EscS